MDIRSDIEALDREGRPPTMICGGRAALVKRATSGRKDIPQYDLTRPDGFRLTAVYSVEEGISRAEHLIQEGKL